MRTVGKRPRDAHLRRAVSTIYYGVFHVLAQNCADLVIGTNGADRSNSAWKQVYRSLQHGAAKDACKERKTVEKFPAEIQDFANTFVTLQQLREDADYDPTTRYAKSDVLTLLKDAQDVSRRFKSAPVKDRRAFAAWVLLQRSRR